MVELVTQICSYLGSQITSLVIGNNLTAFVMPTSPAICTAVVPTGGPYFPADAIRYRQFQIIHRNTVLSSAVSMTNSLFAAFDGQYNVLGCNTGRVFADHEPGPFIRDANNRYLFSLSFTLQIPKD